MRHNLSNIPVRNNDKWATGYRIGNRALVPDLLAPLLIWTRILLLPPFGELGKQRLLLFVCQRRCAG